jgi:hypothetical protein
MLKLLTHHVSHLCHDSDKLAITFMLISPPPGLRSHIFKDQCIKDQRMFADCYSATNFIAMIVGRVTCCKRLCYSLSSYQRCGLCFVGDYQWYPTPCFANWPLGFGYIGLFNREEYDWKECLFRKLLHLITHKYAYTNTLRFFRCMFFRFVTMSSNKGNGSRKEMNKPMYFLGFQFVNMTLIVNISCSKTQVTAILLKEHY